jgi:hypothetical protein
MGVEVSTPIFELESHDGLLPRWINREALVFGNEGSSEPVSIGTTRRFMPTAFRIYGLQHLCNNLNQDVHQNLKWWTWFWTRLKNFERLLAHKPKRTRFAVACMKGTVYENRTKEIINWDSVQLYEPRWHCVLGWLKRFVPLLDFFRKCCTCWSYWKLLSEFCCRFKH